MNETKLHILKIAFKLFIQKNFKDVTMQDIVRETKLSKGAFYHYFESKEQLFVEVINTFYLADELNDQNHFDKSSLKNFYSSYIKHLQKFIGFIKESVAAEKEEEYNNINYFLLVFDAIHRFPDFKEKLKNMHLDEQIMWEEIIEKAKESKEIDTPMSSHHIAKLFIYSIDSNFIHNILTENFTKALASIEDLWDDFYKGLKK
ncbi:MAG: TetR/AcrR family transcriptional regulator [Raineya sp.]|jgi:AcrR family transcriptional regulator|nr:TetR/AcrR family transcriptional regulator [Raineya sp.]